MGSLFSFNVDLSPSPVLQSPDAEGVANFILTSQMQRNIVVLAGAGCSTSAGIPDFRSPGTGLYDNLQKYNLPSPQSIFDIDYFIRQPAAFYELAREMWPGAQGYKPTLTHYFIALLEKKQRLLRCFTQNIDGLEKLAGVPAERIVAAHGSFDSATCLATGAKVKVDEVRAAILAGKEGWQALSERHGGLVKPDIVFFGEGLPQRFFKQRATDLPKCRLLLVMGTSLAVFPFASLPDEVNSTCARVLINKEPVGFLSRGQNPMEEALGIDFLLGDRDVGLLGDCDEQVLLLAKELGWEDELIKLRDS